MQAMRLEEPGPIEKSPLVPRRVDRPEPGAGQVRVRIRTCAICRTDLHVIEADLPTVKLPLTPGHQVVGIVDKFGPGCERLQMGQRIGFGWLRHTDGRCRYCRRGLENLCPASRYTGYHEDGGYAEYAVVGEAYVYELPESYDDVAAAPLLCAGLIGYRALERAVVPDRGRLLLAGFGSSAHIVIQLALHRGHELYVLSRSAAHRGLARQMGAVWAGEDLTALPRKMDSIILFAPVGHLVPPLLEALAPGGTLSIAGIHLSDIPGPLLYEKHLFHEKQVRSVTANTRQDGRNLLAEAAQAGVRPQTTTYPLADANRALKDIKHSQLPGTGVLVMP